MTLSELQHEFPGLFESSACESPCDAERHADKAAAKAGLTVRVASWTSEGVSRQIEYRDPAAKLRLKVEICSESTRGNKPFYLFRCVGERTDAHLTMLSPRAVRAKPSTFQREVQVMVSRLRTLRVEEGGRVTGYLKKWDPDRGCGVIECLPGAIVSLSSTELPSGITVAPSDRLSFLVEKSANVQKATDARKCFPQ